jgi:Protein of unknown function (DUF1523)
MKKPVVILIAVIALIAFGFVASWTSPYWTHGSKVVTVTGVTTKRAMVKGQTKDIYIVFTDDETYENIDSPAYLKFNSSDLQGKLIMTGKFKIEYYGFRVPIFSMYKNIIKAEKVEVAAKP